MATGGNNLHVVFFPLLAPGHMIPLVQAARLFAANGVRSTIITTVHNAVTLKPSIDHDTDLGYPITIHTLNFPSSEVGLPPGVENFSACTNPEMTSALIRGMFLLDPQIEQVIREISPDCIFSDMFYTWTADFADQLKIPRLLFYPNGFFYHSVIHSLKVHAPYADVEHESESFLVPGLPDKIRMKRSQLSNHFISKTHIGDLLEKVLESEKRSYGIVSNTFYEIEPDYADHFKKIKGMNIWHIGPLFEYFNSPDPVSENNDCLSWLDRQDPKSVIFVCFGSMVRFPEEQITEIALALEESKQPFVWVVRKEGDKEIGGLPGGYEERLEIKNKGLIIKGWAPQVEILQHVSVGGFLTHCGWNSVMEAVVAGVPLITWPLYGDHFYNEKLVEILGIGVGVGASVWNPHIKITSPVIGKQNILEAIKVLTSGSVVAERIKRNSKELAMKANKVVKEGGSSVNNLNSLIHELKAIKQTRCNSLT